MQSQEAVSDYFTCEQVPPFGFAWQYLRDMAGWQADNNTGSAVCRQRLNILSRGDEKLMLSNS